jgi:hypothetical protein
LEDQEWVETTRDLVARLNCYLNQKSMERLLSLYLLEEDPQQRQNIKSEIETILGNYAPYLFFSDKPMLPSPTLEECAGEITLGNVIQGEREIRPFSISLRDINKHIAIFASTGSGKTTLMINILRQLLDRSIPWLCFDFKQDLRHLTQNYPIKVLRWNWLRINPLKPPKGVDIQQWMMIIADIFAHIFGWFHASENYLLQYMNKLYEKKKGKGYPTFREVYELMDSTEEKSRRFSEYRDVCRNRLASMLIVLKDVIDCEYGFPVEELLNYPVVIELDGLRRDEANFLLEFFLVYIFTYRLANGHRGKIHHLICFDEATRIFFKKRQWKETTVELGQPFIEQVPQIIRDYSEGLIFAAQEPSIISHSVMANSNLKLVGFLGDGEDIETIERSLDLDEEERSAISKLEVGEWLVKKAGMKPFILKSSDFPLEKNVTDEELKQRMQPFLSRLQEMSKPRTQVPVENADQVEPEARKIRLKMPDLSKDAKALLTDVCEHPFRGLSTRYKLLNFSGRRAESAKTELIQKSLVKEVSIKFGSYRPVAYLVLTNLGLKFLKNAKKETTLWEHVGRVGFEHRLYQVLITYAFRNAGHQAFIEKVVNGKRLDLLVLKENRKIGIELELDSNVELESMLKSLEEVDELIILCNNITNLKAIKEALRKSVVGDGLRKINFHLVNEYLSKLRRNIKPI